MSTYSTTYKRTVNPERLAMPAASSPFKWLQEGWADVIRAPMVSALLGSSFTLLCVVAYAAASLQPVLSATVLSVLLLVSPFIAAAAYSVARQHQEKRQASLRENFTEVRSRAISIGLFSILCAIIVGAWVRLTSIVFALYYGSLGDGAAQLAHNWTTGLDIPAMLVFITAAGALLALTLFAIGAIALPMIVDRNCNVVTAVVSSLEALTNNIGTMMLWMLIVTAYVVLAIMTGLLLMPLVFPLLAYATWHSYQELSQSIER